MDGFDRSGLLGTKRGRAVVLAALVALVFAVLGSARGCAPAALLGSAPINADLALRTLALGWVAPARTAPVAIVAIDTETWRNWGSPAATPRAELVKLLEATTAAGPRAVVLDIDLSFGGESSDDALLLEFLAGYARAAPLVLPKRLERGDDGRLRAARSTFDAVVVANPRLAWAHAAFETADGGAVRLWSPWIALCGSGDGDWMPAVALRVAQLAPSLDSQPASRDGPPGEDPCAGATVAPRRLLVGPRLTDPGRPVFARDAHSVSATLLLDPEIARDDAQLFADRVVFIGATHASAGDAWLTVAGVYPGVELLANTVRYAPLDSGILPAGSFGFRVKALTFFLLIAACVWWLRGLVAVFVAGLGTVVLVVVAAGAFDDLGIFDALEAGLLLVIAWVALRSVTDLAADWRVLRRDRPGGVGGWLATLAAVCLREQS